MKLKIGVIFGGKSLEHELSIITALQAMENIDTDKYEVIVDRTKAIEKAIEAVEKQTIAEKERQKALAEEKKMVNTPEWIEKYARFEMGYAAPDEIVFIDSTVSN